MSDNLTRVEATKRAAQISGVDYTVHLTVSDDLGRDTFTSDTEITFTASSGDETFVDFRAKDDQSFARLELNGVALPATAYDAKTGRISFTPLAGANTLRVVAECEYSTTGVGLHRAVDPADGNVYMYTHAEPFDAHKFYACFDQPDLKAKFRSSLTGPSHWELASLTEVEAQITNGTSKTATFRQSELIATYLNAFIAGDYVAMEETHRGIPMPLYARKSLQKELVEQSPEIFEITRKMLDYFEKKFGIPYPYPIYGQAFVPEFNMGAMENPGLVILNDAICLFRGQVTASSREYRNDVHPHEGVHHYNGDLVTPVWWDDLWLNESFATVVALLCAAEITGSNRPFVDFAIARKVGALRSDQIRDTTHPVEADVPDIDTLSLNFDPLTYGKGASVLRQMVAWLGEDVFYAGVGKYLQAHAGGNATRADLFGFLSRESGRDLTRWEHDWLQTTGLSTLRADVKVTGGTYSSVAVVQESDLMRQHRVRLGLYDLRGGKLVRTDTLEVDVDGPRTEIAKLKGRQAAALLVVNDGDLTYAKIRMDAGSLATLEHHITDIEDPLTRAVCWASLWDMCRDGELAASEFARIVIDQLPREQDALIVERMVGYLNSTLINYVDPASRRTMQARASRVARRALLAAAPGSELQRSWFGAFVVNAGSSDVAALQYLLDDRSLAGARVDKVAPGFELSPKNRWSVVHHLVSRGWAGENLIDDELARDNTTSGRLSALSARASIPTVQAKEWAWQQLSDPSFRNLHSIKAIAGGFQQVGQEKLTEKYTRQYAQLVGSWQAREQNVAQALTASLFPGTVDQQTIEIADAALATPDLPASARRLILESKDALARTLRVRTLDASGQQQVA